MIRCLACRGLSKIFCELRPKKLKYGKLEGACHQPLTPLTQRSGKSLTRRSKKQVWMCKSGQDSWKSKHGSWKTGQAS